MTAYTRDEIVSASDVARKFSAILKDIMQDTKERFVISKNNKLQAVVLPIEEYEKLQEAYDLMEHTQIYKSVQERKNSKTVSLEESASKYGIDIDAI
jgi:prevent-host-death family protein